MSLQKRQMRIQVLEALYQIEFQNEKHPQSLQTESLESKEMIQSILTHKEKIDLLLSQHSQNWKLSRMASLDLTILRIAVYEMIFSPKKDSPKIFINEAIELAKLYGSLDSPRFINGILDSVAQQASQK